MNIESSSASTPLPHGMSRTSPGLWNTLLLLPCNTSGLIGAVFSSVGKPELPTPSGPNSLAGPTSLFEDPVQLDVLHTELRSFCTFSDPIQVAARDEYYDEVLNRVATSGSGPDSTTSGLGSESDSNGTQSQTGSPKVCKTPEQQQELAYMQPTVSQLVEPRVYPEPSGPPKQALRSISTSMVGFGSRLTLMPSLGIISPRTSRIG
jgi:hypothetical protein